MFLRLFFYKSTILSLAKHSFACECVDDEILPGQHRTLSFLRNH